MHQLVVLHFAYIFTYYGVITGIAHNVDTAEIGYGRKYGVRAIEKCHFSFVIWGFAWSN